jgi:hypothetical protein
MSNRITVALFCSAALSVFVIPQPAQAATLVGDPFASSYSGWTEAFPAPTRGGNWRLSLHSPALIDTNNANPPTAGGGTNTGLYEPDVMFQNNFTVGGTYDLSATMRTNDDDLFGLVWNYIDANNYYRTGIRQQPASGTFGGTEGLSVQKVVGGVVTQISPAGTGIGAASPVTQAMIDARTPFSLKVAVDGVTGGYQVSFNNTSVVSGTDAGLINGSGKIGVQSWAQQSDAAAVTPFWGTEVESIQVAQGGGTVYSETFNARPIVWRALTEKNQASISVATAGQSKELIGNFGRSMFGPWIHQDSNGFLNATVNNTDFIGPAVVVDEPGATGLTDYEMKVRIGAGDNDGLGVIVRAQDDNNYYRITFASEATGAGTTRAPQGMSVQKVLNGTWSELFREVTPAYIYPFSAANSFPTTAGFNWFDVSVKAIGNTLAIQVIDHLGNTINYPLIPDTTNPLLSGTVGLHTWGTEDVFWTNYGGVSGAPLLVEVPEPGTICLALLTAAALCTCKRRRMD